MTKPGAEKIHPAPSRGAASRTMLLAGADSRIGGVANG